MVALKMTRLTLDSNRATPDTCDEGAPSGSGGIAVYPGATWSLLLMAGQY
jgi:hypothetical protein